MHFYLKIGTHSFRIERIYSFRVGQVIVFVIIILTKF